MGELQHDKTPAFQTVATSYVNEADERVLLDFIEYYDASALEGGIFPKDVGVPETFVHNGMEFYVFANAGSWSAVWSDAQYCIFVSAPSREIVISILKSIP